MQHMDEIDIWRSAKLLIDQHGIFADDRARDRQFELFTKDDAAGFAVWGRIREAIRELQRIERRDGENVQ